MSHSYKRESRALYKFYCVTLISQARLISRNSKRLYTGVSTRLYTGHTWVYRGLNTTYTGLYWPVHWMYMSILDCTLEYILDCTLECILDHTLGCILNVYDCILGCTLECILDCTLNIHRCTLDHTLTVHWVYTCILDHTQETWLYTT